MIRRRTRHSDCASHPRGYWIATDFNSGFTETTTELTLWSGAGSMSLATFAEWGGQLGITRDHAFMFTYHDLSRVPLAGGSPTLVRTLTEASRWIGAQGESVFFSPDGKSIVRLDDATGSQTTLAYDVEIDRCGFCTHTAAWVDDSGVFFTDWSMGPDFGLDHLGSDGSAPRVIAKSGIPVAITTDSCNVYWIALTEGQAQQWSLMAVGK
jgi:hypothetical protein